MVPPPERGMGGNGAREERPHALYCGEGSRGPKARSERGRPGPTSFHDSSHRVRSWPREASVVLTPSWKSAVDQWLAQLGVALQLSAPRRASSTGAAAQQRPP
jgi:hypothetical protein